MFPRDQSQRYSIEGVDCRTRAFPSSRRGNRKSSLDSDSSMQFAPSIGQDGVRVSSASRSRFNASETTDCRKAQKAVSRTRRIVEMALGLSIHCGQ